MCFLCKIAVDKTFVGFYNMTAKKLKDVKRMNSKYIQYFRNVLPCIKHGIICGSLTGAVIFLFRYCSKYIESISRALYAVASQSPLGCIIAVVVSCAFALLMYLLHKKIPEIKGGGIPRSEGILRGLLPFRWLPTFVGTVAGSFISFFCGIPVGSEGPAVLIGTCLGGACCARSKNRYAIDRYVMTGGAGAGFAVATGAPLSAMLFALEEIHKRFTPMLVMTVSVSVLCSTVVNRLLCSVYGISPYLFSFEGNFSFGLSRVPYLVLLGVLTALAVGVFDKSIHLFKRFSKFAQNAVPAWAKLTILFFITSIMGLFFTEGIYSGHHVIEEVHHNHTNLFLLAAILVIRLFMMLVITDCGATGGIFIPTLAIGALFGAIASRLLIFIGLPEELCCAVTLLGMCGFLGGTLRAPFTACVLFAELTGGVSELFYVALTVFTVNLITELIGQVPFYDMVLEHTVRKQNKGVENSTKYYKMTVADNSFVVGKTVRDVMWPYFCVVLSVEHMTDYSDRYFNDGEKKLSPGDVVTVRVRQNDSSDVEKRLFALTGCKPSPMSEG